MANKINDGSVVTMAYTLSDEKGQVLEDRTPENPFIYIQGRQQILAAVEEAVNGQTAGFRADLSLKPEDAFGAYVPSLVAEMRRRHFPQDLDLKVGMKFTTQGPRGEPLAVRVIAIDGEKITIDGNHPLAGATVRFELRVLDVRAASPEETRSGIPDEGGGSSHLH